MNGAFGKSIETFRLIQGAAIEFAHSQLCNYSIEGVVNSITAACTKIMTVSINMFVKSFQSRHSTCLWGRTQLLQSTTYTPILYIAHCRIDVYSALQSEKKHLSSNYGNINTRVSET